MDYRIRHMTRNDCYRAGRKIKPTGIVVHSTATPGVMAAAWFARWNKSFAAGETNRQVCAHMFIDDKEAWEYLPINPDRGEAHRSWLHGGSANNTHLGFEMCEPGGFTYRYPGAAQVGYDVDKNQAYFDAVYKNAVQMCAKWCREFDIKVDNIIDHAEGSRKGICSASADVGHWFPKHGKSMDTLRADVRRELEGKPIGEGDIMLKRGDRGESVYDYQKVLFKLGYDMGEWPDMKTGDKNGLDGSFGGHTEAVTHQAQKDFSITQDGIVRADLYGKLALALSNLKPEPKPEPASKDFLVRVNVDVLNVRNSPSTDGTRVTTKVSRNDVFTIVDTQGDWGRLKSGMGWIYLPLTQKL